MENHADIHNSNGVPIAGGSGRCYSANTESLQASSPNQCSPGRGVLVFVKNSLVNSLSARRGTRTGSYGS